MSKTSKTNKRNKRIRLEPIFRKEELLGMRFPVYTRISGQPWLRIDMRGNYIYIYRHNI